MGVRDEQWGNGQVFTVGEGRGGAAVAEARWLMESGDGFDMEEEEQEYLLHSRFEACFIVLF